MEIIDAGQQPVGFVRVTGPPRVDVSTEPGAVLIDDELELVAADLEWPEARAAKQLGIDGPKAVAKHILPRPQLRTDGEGRRGGAGVGGIACPRHSQSRRSKQRLARQRPVEQRPMVLIGQEITK